MTTLFIKTKDTFQGDNTNRVWPLSYPYLSVQDLRVTVINPKGIGACVNKHLRFDSENVCIVYPTLESDLQPLGEGWSICIERQAPICRQIPATDSAPFAPEDLTPIEQLARIEEIRAIKHIQKEGV